MKKPQRHRGTGERGAAVGAPGRPGQGVRPNRTPRSIQPRGDIEFIGRDSSMATARCKRAGCTWWQTYCGEKAGKRALAGLRTHTRMKHGRHFSVSSASFAVRSGGTR